MNLDIDHLENLLSTLGLKFKREEKKLIVELRKGNFAIIHLHTSNVTTLDIRDSARLDGAPNKRLHVAAMPAIAIAGICYGYSKL